MTRAHLAPGVAFFLGALAACHSGSAGNGAVGGAGGMSPAGGTGTQGSGSGGFGGPGPSGGGSRGSAGSSAGGGGSGPGAGGGGSAGSSAGGGGSAGSGPGGAGPGAPTRSEIAAVHLTFQGLTVTLPDYGSIPWFEPAISSVSAADRQLVYAAKRAAGDTHLIIPLSWNYSGDGGYSYPVPGTDLTGNLPAFRSLVEEAIQNGFYVMAFLAGDGESNPAGGYNDPVGWTYGYSWLMQHLPSIVTALQKPSDLTPYVILVPGWDGVAPGWAPDASNPASGTYAYPSELDNYLLQARSLLPNGYLGVELGAGNCHWGGGAGNYTSPAGQGLDILLQEFPGPPTGDPVWQIAARELGPAYVRPPDEPAGDDPSPPFYLSPGTPRGPFVPVAFEYDEYRWVRAGVAAAQIQQEQAYLKSVGYPHAD